jgi:hypothetical protein
MVVGKLVNPIHLDNPTSTKFVQDPMESGNVSTSLHSRIDKHCKLDNFPIDVGKHCKPLHLSKFNTCKLDKFPMVSGKVDNTLFPLDVGLAKLKYWRLVKEEKK